MLSRLRDLRRGVPRRDGWAAAARSERALEAVQVAILVTLALVVVAVAAITGRGMVDELDEYQAQQRVQSKVSALRVTLQEQETAFWRHRAEGGAGTPPEVARRVLAAVSEARALRIAQAERHPGVDITNGRAVNGLGALATLLLTSDDPGPRGSAADALFIGRFTSLLTRLKTAAAVWTSQNAAVLEESNARVVAATRRLITLTGSTALLAILLGLLTWRLVSRSRRRIVAALQSATERLQYLADTDPLTGLSNQRLLRDRLDEVIASDGAGGAGLSAIMIDLDHFKAVNDTFGHPVGDKVLVETARRLRDSSRAGDVVARIGGEEFLMLLPDTDSVTAFAVAERVRAAVRSSDYPAGVGRLTASLGVSTLSGELDAEGLIAQADAALYWAKRHGRDASFRYSPEFMAARSARARASSSWPAPALH